jgi:hypothetical protein
MKDPATKSALNDIPNSFNGIEIRELSAIERDLEI